MHVAVFDSRRNPLEKEAVLSESTISSTDIEAKRFTPPEVQPEDQVVQLRVGPEKGTSAGLEGKAHYVKEAVFDGTIGSCAGTNIAVQVTWRA